MDNDQIKAEILRYIVTTGGYDNSVNFNLVGFREVGNAKAVLVTIEPNLPAGFSPEPGEEYYPEPLYFVVVDHTNRAALYPNEVGADIREVQLDPAAFYRTWED